MICELTQLLSIYSSLFMLMTQALISRVLVPGMSNFVNASVRRLLAPASGSALLRLRGHILRAAARARVTRCRFCTPDPTMAQAKQAAWTHTTAAMRGARSQLC
jgi:hypothetical protein